MADEHKPIALAIFRIEHNWTLPGKKGKPDWSPILINPEDPRPQGYPQAPVDANAWNYDENLYTLMQYRGAEDVARRLAGMPHVTPHFIREQMRQAAEHNQDVITALYRIEHNEPLPETWMYASGGEESSQAGIGQLARKLEATQKRRR